jgi:hypothetical protein
MSDGGQGLNVGERSSVKKIIHGAAVGALAATAITGIETYLLAPAINNRTV